MAQTASVTGQKPTPAPTTFTIVVSVKAKGFGACGTCGVIPAVFTSGRPGKKKGEHKDKSAEEPAPLEAVAVLL